LVPRVFLIRHTKWFLDCDEFTWVASMHHYGISSQQSTCLSTATINFTKYYSTLLN
jgi:hypothetical protein